MSPRSRVQFLTFVTLVAGAFIGGYVVTAAGYLAPEAFLWGCLFGFGTAGWLVLDLWRFWARRMSR